MQTYHLKVYLTKKHLQFTTYYAIYKLIFVLSVDLTSCTSPCTSHQIKIFPVSFYNHFATVPDMKDFYFFLESVAS